MNQISIRCTQFNGQKITLEDLATHASGLPEFPQNYGGLLSKERMLDPNFNASSYSANHLYEGLSNTTLSSEPGLEYRYSNFGMGLLGHILSLKAGIPYEQLVKDKILNTLGMNDTRITISGIPDSRLAVGHKGGLEIVTPELSEG